jgi:hypothetical protein
MDFSGNDPYEASGYSVIALSLPPVLPYTAKSSPEVSVVLNHIDTTLLPVALASGVSTDNSTSLEFSTNEDTSFTITQAELLANASDIDGDTLIVTNDALLASASSTIVPSISDASAIIYATSSTPLVEDNAITFTEAELLALATNIDGDTLSIAHVSYTGPGFSWAVF